jgi:tetratricopeptide (TPR) repeat protein
MPRAQLAALILALAPAARAEIRSAEACDAAIAADPAAAREEAAVWTRLGGGTEAELCEAAALEAMGAFGSAALLLTRLAEDPNRAHAPALRLAIYEDAARLWLAAGRPDLARAALANLDRLAPGATPERLELAARAAAAEEDWPAALTALDALLAAEPGDARIMALRAAALREGGDPRAAAEAAAAALAIAPDLPEALFEVGAAAAEAGDLAAAERSWLALIAAHPDDPLATLARRNLAALD